MTLARPAPLTPTLSPFRGEGAHLAAASPLDSLSPQRVERAGVRGARVPG